MLIYLSLNLNSDLKQSECNIIQIYQKKNLSIWIENELAKFINIIKLIFTFVNNKWIILFSKFWIIFLASNVFVRKL